MPIPQTRSASRTAAAVVALTMLTPANASEHIKARFDVTLSGARVGEIEWTIRSSDAGEVEFTTVNRTVGLARLIRDVTITEFSYGVLRDGVYRSRDYRYERKGDKRASLIQAHFDWQRAEATISKRTKSNNESRTESLQQPLVDDLGHLLALGAALEAGDTSPGFRVLRRDSVRDYQYSLEAREARETALGKLDTVRLRRIRAGDDRETTIWSAPAMQFLPVRIEHREKDKHIEIHLITWSHTNSAD